MTTKRWTLVAGSAGLVGGLALGVTGLAAATAPTPSPNGGAQATRPYGPGPGRHMGREHHGPGGLVSGVSGSSLTVRTPSGSQTIGLTGATTYYAGRTKATKAVVNVGDIVHVRLVDPQATTLVAAVVTVVPAHLAGFVTKIDGGTITILDGSGFTRTITTSGSTTYDKNGVAGSATDITVGTFVHALGSVDANGTTLDATKIGTGFPAMGDRSGREDGPGNGPAGDLGPEGPDGAPGDGSAA